MFESIMKFFKKVNKKEEKETNHSREAAKERLHLVLMQDRANVSADFLELMKQEIIEVIKKYIDVDEGAIDVRLTNQDNGEGTNGAPALYANIPIVNIKNEARKVAKDDDKKEKEKEKNEKKENKKQEEKKEEQQKEKQEEKEEEQQKENQEEEKRDEVEELENEEKPEMIEEVQNERIAKVILESKKFNEKIKESADKEKEDKKKEKEASKKEKKAKD